MLKQNNFIENSDLQCQNNQKSQEQNNHKRIQNFVKQKNLEEKEKEQVEVEEPEGRTPNRVPFFMKKNKLFDFNQSIPKEISKENSSFYNISDLTITSPVKKIPQSFQAALEQEQLKQSQLVKQSNSIVSNEASQNLFQLQESQDQSSIFKPSKKSDSHILQSSEKIQSVFQQQKRSRYIKSLETQENNAEINQTADIYINKLKAVNNLNLLQKIRKMVLGFRLCKKKKYLKQKGLSTQMIKVVEQHVRKELDILQLYKDIILIKKAIMILFTPEQLATLQLIGCSSKYLNQNSSETDSSKLNEYEELSYYEQQLQLFQCIKLQNKQIQSFLKRCQVSSNLSEIDQRILSSICKDYNN
ncbi:hypothetical protein ABPG73_017754 [Tetrahymena malaccensis]